MVIEDTLAQYLAQHPEAKVIFSHDYSGLELEMFQLSESIHLMQTQLEQLQRRHTAI